jgi:hypothetical protein
MSRPAVLDKLSARQGKVLRYVCSTRDLPVTPARCIVGIEWSDLPHTDLQARKALDVLRRYGLISRTGKSQYEPTAEGKEAIKHADKEDLWRQAPPPKVTNKSLHRKGKQ